mmetsp:Transcript_37966/g.46314  ORF Transcript_37966/g.46314 Transcript_37966/m.46314 type:complete len:84 (+) Transcript_37966:233-484(+)
MLDIFSRSMTGLRVEDSCFEQNLGTLITGHLCISNQKTLHYSVNKELSELKIDADPNALLLHVSGISLDIKFDYSMWTEPELI